MNFSPSILFARSVAFISFLISDAAAQTTYTNSEPYRQLAEIRDHMLQKEYGKAYPLVGMLRNREGNAYQPMVAMAADELDYYFILCRLVLRIPAAEAEAIRFLDRTVNPVFSSRVSHQLANHYFHAGDHDNAVKYFSQSDFRHLDNEELADTKFRMAYSLFNLKRFGEAEPLFNEIHQIPDSRYYVPANYYYGFIAYSRGNFSVAERCFRQIENEESYKGVVPYYLAVIMYYQQKKADALQYSESLLSRGGIFYDKELHRLVGQIYYEQEKYPEALSHLQQYVSGSDKVSREDMYAVSYAAYRGGKYPQAIEGFRQLSNETDSLGQYAMYFLGDCYLKTNRKSEARAAFQFCAHNNSHAGQQEISRFNYAKLSYELGYQDVALAATQDFTARYPQSVYRGEAAEILVAILANTNNFREALDIYRSFDNPTTAMQQSLPRILYGRATELLNDQQISQADELFSQVLRLPASSVSPYAQFWKGEIAYRAGDYDGAIRYLTAFSDSRVAASGEASNVNARYTLGYCWLKKENFREALSFFEPIGKSTTSATGMEQDAFVRTGDCHYMLRDFTRASAVYSKVTSAALTQSDYALYQQALIAGIKNGSSKISMLNSLTTQYPRSSLVPDAYMEIANSYLSDEKFTEAIRYLDKVIELPGNSAYKPGALLKKGLAYYNLDNNREALAVYNRLVQTYPRSTEIADALENIRAIYVSEGRPGEYIDLLRRNGISVSDTEADSLTYAAAHLRYEQKDCPGALSAFSDYLKKYPTGKWAQEASYLSGECHASKKDWVNAMAAYDKVFAGGYSAYYEKATLAAAKIAYVELKDYAAAKKYFTGLRSGALHSENQQEALRGLVRCYYQLRDYDEASSVADELLQRKGISTDDKSVAYLVLGKSKQKSGDCTAAISAFRSCAAINRSAWGAEARYELAACQFTLKNYTAAEKAAQAVIRETGSYDYWVTGAYVLLGDLFMQSGDYFNAKATFQSVADNAVIPEWKEAATRKLADAVAAEKAGSKVQ